MPPLTDRFPLPVLQEAPGAGEAGPRGAERPRPWRSLEEWRGSPEVARAAAREFPPGATEPPRGIERRLFLQLAGTSAIMAGLTACKRSPEKVMPYTRQPEGVVPGNPQMYSTAFPLEGYATGLAVESYEGHPTKVEGNPDHPASLGAASAIAQASLWDLYDPTRPQTVKHRGTPHAWKAYLEQQTERARRLEERGGEGLWLLVEPTASPTMRALLERIQARFPRARTEGWLAVSRDNVYEGARLAFGRPLETRARYEQAKVVLALDSDFLAQGPSFLRDARQFTQGREPKRGEMSRLYVAEAHFSVTGMYADHRFQLRPSEVERFALAVLGELARTHALPALARFRELPLAWPEKEREVKAVASDLAAHGERAVVVAGHRQPARVHAVAHALNAALGSLRSLLIHHEPALSPLSTGPGGLRALVDAARAGSVDTLVMTAWNPVYSAPVDVELGAVLGQVPNSVYLGLREDETSERSAWFLPAAHVLESWGDARAQDGTASIIQPLISPIFHGVTELQALAPFAGVPDQGPYELVREHWRRQRGEADFDEAWEQWLAVGVIPGTTLPEVTPEVDWGALEAAVRGFSPRPPERLELNLLPGYKVHDGRFFGNSALQELPEPLTKLSWSNAALLSPRTAERLKVEPREKVRLTLRGRSLEAAVYVLPGHADDTVSLELGWGRKGPEPMEEELGFNAYRLRHADAFWFQEGLTVEKLTGEAPLSTVQDHWTMHGREIALEDTLEEFERKRPGYLHHLKGPVDKLYDPFHYEDEPYKWAMAVDLNRCTGCGACIVACQTENNIPVVGRQQVENGREMYWLRVDRYFTGSPHEPHAIPQPMMCQHCEAAPCEYVCPVNATVHSDEGLNEMIYNRCIGTRYCSNNCPYKVRRFNYLNYNTHIAEVEKLRLNPQVTVRTRGVMEKCTYCVQRIERARIQARRAGQRIDTKALQTACQQTCPTEAIVFGSLHEGNSAVARWHQDERHYEVLHDLGTRPRTVYLARIKNPNPELERG